MLVRRMFFFLNKPSRFLSIFLLQTGSAGVIIKERLIDKIQER